MFGEAGDCVTAPWGALWRHFLGRRVCHRDLGHVSGVWWGIAMAEAAWFFTLFGGVGARLRHGSISWGVVCATATWDTLAVFCGASHGLLFFTLLDGAGACVTAVWGALWQHFLGRRVCHRDLGHVLGVWWGIARADAAWLRHSGAGRVMAAFLGRRVCRRDLGHVSVVWWGIAKTRSRFVFYVVWWGGRLRHSGVGRVMAAFFGTPCVPPRLGTR